MEFWRRYAKDGLSYLEDRRQISLGKDPKESFSWGGEWWKQMHRVTKMWGSVEESGDLYGLRIEPIIPLDLYLEKRIGEDDKTK